MKVLVKGGTLPGGHVSGRYEVDGDKMVITLGEGREREIAQGKIIKLTAMELIWQDEDGKIEEYARK